MTTTYSGVHPTPVRSGTEALSAETIVGLKQRHTGHKVRTAVSQTTGTR